MNETTRTPARNGEDGDALLSREWLVTNGLGGYASGTVGGAVTRRYHGVLVAALPAPLGRTVMLNHLWEELRLPGGRTVLLGGHESADRLELHGAPHLVDFRLEMGLPVWRFDVDGFVIEKRIVMPHFLNSVHVTYALLEGDAPLRLRLRPSCHFRSYEDAVDEGAPGPYELHVAADRFSIHAPGSGVPPLRLAQRGGERPAFVTEPRHLTEVHYRVEQMRGYAARGQLWSPGYFRAELTRDSAVSLMASTEEWSSILAFDIDEARQVELQRRQRLLSMAPQDAQEGIAAELVLAADQFIIRPAGRVAEAARAHAAGRELRTVIAGYHWFTDWGRDTMIALEGLTLATGRHREATDILRTFARYVRDGLIPNMFPDQSTDGLYHTADATLWFFHAVARYLRATGDLATVRELVPVFREIVERHRAGTRFGIAVDPADGLLRQGADGYQLTWMDAKVDGWVVTPRRGKAVEINALWYNALRSLADWHELLDEGDEAHELRAEAERVHASFNRRFWSDELGHLYDVVDGEDGDDGACRPNQVFAMSLDHPVLERRHWNAVLETVRSRLLTPVGLRSLAPDHPDYRPTYTGDLRSRDAAYHQGTVWAWLIGPFVDAWLRCHPDDRDGARSMLHGLAAHLDEFGVGSVAEIFDAEEPYAARGCIAQAWSVAELLRCWLATEPAADPPRPSAQRQRQQRGPVHGVAAVAHDPVEVRPGDAAGGADAADDLAGLHGVAHATSLPLRCRYAVTRPAP
jgi:predicted glycogen debranching enzyme